MVTAGLSRRQLLGAGLAVGSGTAAGTALAACAPGATTPSSPVTSAQTGPATVVFLTRGSENHRQLFDRFAEEFKKLQPKTTITQEFVPGGTPPFLEKET